MSTEEESKKRKNQEIKRSKQSRRKALKSMVAGSGAVIAGKATSEQWSKPIVNSVLLPAHAQTSLVCVVTTSMLAASSTDGALGTFAAPGSYTTAATDAADLTVTPQVSVTPGTTDLFNLTTVVTGGNIGSPGAADLIQTVAPTANGVIPFNAIVTLGHDDSTTNYTMTLSPNNPSFCGAPQVIDITFPDGRP